VPFLASMLQKSPLTSDHKILGIHVIDTKS
jgi:hypothetical protein